MEDGAGLRGTDIWTASSGAWSSAGHGYLDNGRGRAGLFFAGASILLLEACFSLSQGLFEREALPCANRGNRGLEAGLLLFGDLGRFVDWDEHVTALLQGFELFRNVDAVPVHDDGHGQSIPSFPGGF